MARVSLGHMGSVRGAGWAGGLAGWAWWVGRVGPRSRGFSSFFVCFLFCIFFLLFIFFSVLFQFKLFRHFIKMCLLHHIYLCKIWHLPNIFVLNFEKLLLLTLI